MTESLFILGSEGVIGKYLSKELSNSYEVQCFDLALGHDLTNSSVVEQIFSSNSCDLLLNLFALNEHVGRANQAKSFEDFAIQDLKAYMNTNVVALFDVCRAFIKHNKKGAVVNYTSIYGLTVPDNTLYESGSMKHIGYSISKSAVIPLTNYFAKNSGPTYRFNTIAPGGVFDHQPQSFVDKYSSRTPLKRMCTKEDLLGPTQFLLSSQAHYINGVTLPVDGGFSIP